MVREDYMNIKEAAEHLRVSRTKIWRLIKAGRLETYTDPRDERATLVKKADLEQFRQIRRLA